MGRRRWFEGSFLVCEKCVEKKEEGHGYEEGGYGTHEIRDRNV